MDLNNEEILRQANNAIIKGDNEGFLAFCSEKIEWNFVGNETLIGKEKVRQYMIENYKIPPVFTVEQIVSDEKFVIAIGKIDVKQESGEIALHSYCDVWHISNGKLDRLVAFVIKI